MYQDMRNSQFQSTGDLRMKKGISNQETCQEHHGKAKSPKIPCYGNDSSLEELKSRSGNSKTTINSIKFSQRFILMIWNVCRRYTKNFTKFQITEDDSMESQSYLPATRNSPKIPR